MSSAAGSLRPVIREETSADIPRIRALTRAAFDGVAHSSRTEAAIVDALRAAGALTLSLVAELDGKTVGHVAFSAVRIDGRDLGWLGLGPVSVAPDLQRRGIGSALIGEGLARIEAEGAAGCVVLGDPAYYARFGFGTEHALRYGDVPPRYFQSRRFRGPSPSGEVAYHTGFEAT
ncbi:GNAT family N-acetyltransferase [Thalassobaculum sp.]|uniref:GNAT family N-acetyltransferase n=1 Tax=Thalassobaculum sp. TaxID=2022740 RepID=UPI003B5950F2